MTGVTTSRATRGGARLFGILILKLKLLQFHH